MSTFILHHFDASPFAEKIRLVFGIKAAPWQSVQIPMIMPKPNLTALTGGYRKTPVLQIGAEVYCDTLCIAQEIEARQPVPSLFPTGRRGLALALSRWSDKAFFEPGAALSMGENPQVPGEVIEDRKQFFNFMDFSKLAESLPQARWQLQAQIELLEDALAGDDPYLDGERPGYTDILGYFPVWMTNANVPSAPRMFDPYPRVREWAARMSEVGHGDRSDIDAADALAVARETEPSDEGTVDADNELSLTQGESVIVCADDYGQDAIAGTLLHLDTQRVTIRREEGGIGPLNVHFPAIGFRVGAA
ncbi:MAG: glutathione S-transferase family protein [Pseudomonadota bacterium]